MMRTFKGSDISDVSQATGSVVLLLTALILHNPDWTLKGLLYATAAVLALFLAWRWLQDKQVRNLTFTDNSLTIGYRRRKITLERQQIAGIESVGSIKAPAWFIDTDQGRYLLRTSAFPQHVRLQVLDQMQKFRSTIG
ncbi:hypothetical protein [Gallaecimonas sp. GXIMD1310]|uniref:hypothetical protein n=1 Tax=Gallaecimonas sp. GXIMD1310 TaxID=3131926 RepID=UPI00324A0837